MGTSALAMPKKPITPERAAIGKRLMDAAKKVGIGQNELARKFGKAAISTTNGWKTGRTQPSLEELAKIVEWTGESADRIIGAPNAPSESVIDALARKRMAELLEGMSAEMRQRIELLDAKKKEE